MKNCILCGIPLEIGIYVLKKAGSLLAFLLHIRYFYIFILFEWMSGAY